LNSNQQSDYPVDGRQSKAFWNLAKIANFTNSGKGSFVIRSAISRATDVLEAHVGCRLLSKTDKKNQGAVVLLLRTHMNTSLKLNQPWFELSGGGGEGSMG
jgi:uncharacterized protein (DUF1778 family)